jgi:peptidoglycan/xylan/chitin deacetylase (PgdA/CDA1 family)
MTAVERKKIKRLAAPASIALAGMRRRGLHAVILCYHAIGPSSEPEVVSIDAFREQMRFLVTHHELMALGDLVGRIQDEQPSAAQVPVAVTFDDAYSSVVQYALPVLLECGVSATIFPVAEGWGEEMRWRSSLSDPYRTLWTEDQARRWRQAGMQIGSHGVKHLDLTRLTEPELAWELRESRRLIAVATGAAVDGFCYPWGRNRARERVAVRDAGYAYAVAGGYSTRHVRSDVWGLERVMIEHDDSLRDFQVKLAGGYDWLSFVNRLRTVVR